MKLLVLIMIAMVCGSCSIPRQLSTSPGSNGIRYSGKPLGGTIEVPKEWKYRQNINPIYTDTQWTPEEGCVAVGIIYATLPVSISSDLIISLAKKKYDQTGKNGRILRNWSDGDQRWLVVEDDKFHATICIISRGTEIWGIYCGYRQECKDKPETSERYSQALAAMNSFTR